LQVNEDHVDTIIKCICLLHNIIIDQEGIDDKLLVNIHQTNTEIEISRRNNRSKTVAYAIRDQFKEYFNNIGAVHFQNT